MVIATDLSVWKPPESQQEQNDGYYKRYAIFAFSDVINLSISFVALGEALKAGAAN